MSFTNFPFSLSAALALVAWLALVGVVAWVLWKGRKL